MSGRYLLDTSVAIRVLNQKVDLEARRGRDLEIFLCSNLVLATQDRHFGYVEGLQVEDW